MHARIVERWVMFWVVCARIGTLVVSHVERDVSQTRLPKEQTQRPWSSELCIRMLRRFQGTLAENNTPFEERPLYAGARSGPTLSEPGCVTVYEIP